MKQKSAHFACTCVMKMSRISNQNNMSSIQISFISHLLGHAYIMFHAIESEFILVIYSAYYIHVSNVLKHRDDAFVGEEVLSPSINFR